jgi:hypothetical protein
MNLLEPYHQTYSYDTGNNLTHLSHQDLVISLNLVLVGLRLGLKNRQVGEKWVSDDCSYLCKGLIINNPSKNIGCLLKKN